MVCHCSIEGHRCGWRQICFVSLIVLRYEAMEQGQLPLPELSLRAVKFGPCKGLCDSRRG
jgi:hypothetical protein